MPRLEYCCSDRPQVSSGGDQNADGEHWNPVTVDDTPETPKLEFQLEGLTPNKRYKLIVRARNDLGWSNYSNEFIFQTAPGSYTLHYIHVCAAG